MLHDKYLDIMRLLAGSKFQLDSKSGSRLVRSAQSEEMQNKLIAPLLLLHSSQGYINVK